MKFYLSSYKLGDKTALLEDMIAGVNKKTAYISNALDFSTDLERRRLSEDSDIADLEALGMVVEKLDLRKFFGKKEDLAEKMADFGIIWVRGGNVFTLRQAMKLSGFDQALKELIKKNDMVYGAYSAGACVLSPTLRGIHLVDDPTADPYQSQTESIWDGLGILDYSFVPHYDSLHPESCQISKEVDCLKENNMPFKTFKDGEVLIIEKNN